ncbi:MAG: lytic transglycosylase domain-containing protein [Gaiellaceae bacterium]
MQRRLSGKTASLLAIGLVVLSGFAALAIYAVAEEPSWYARLRYPLHYEHIIASHSENYEIDGALLAAVIYRESEFDPDAVSPSGAVGLMQLLPATADGIATFTGGDAFERDDLYDPELNVRYGSFYLKRLLDRYGELELALAAYNAGQTTVDGWLEDSTGIAYPETRAYVRDIVRIRDVYRRSYGGRLGARVEEPTATAG